MAFELMDLKQNNSSLLNLLTQHLPDMLWVKDLEGKYIYANKAICNDLLMAKDTQEPIGKGDIFFALREREAHKEIADWHTFGELCFNSDQLVIDSNKAMKFEEYGNVKGKLMYLEVYKAPFYDKDGNIIGTVGAGRDITQLKKIQFDLENSLEELDTKRDQLEFQANHDALTGLPNRVLFMDRLTQAIKLAKREKQHVAVLFLDIDDFKKINDSLGHHVGDEILIEVTQRMLLKMRKSDTLARLGGDEFCIIINNIKDIDDVSKIIENGMEVFRDPFITQEHTLYISISVGVSLYPNDGKDAIALLKNSDAAMYKAKQNTRDRYSFYDEEMTKKAYERIFLETEMRKAFEKDEFVVYFQPQVHAKTKILTGMEALVRWQHPDMGFIYPDRFIPLAESTGMIIKLDRIVMKKAISQFSRWKKSGLEPKKVSINLTMTQLAEGDFYKFIKELLEYENVSASEVEFEITEREIMGNPDASIKALEKLNELGISVAIDDFGTGYSSLTYLKRLPINKLKIDKSFIDNIPKDLSDSAIVKTIINLCENLELQVIAEGVEEENQNDFLFENNCEDIQGFLFSHPINVKDMEEFIKKHT
ncbi:sensor domain-containing protein [Sulfurimonas autotrophica]|uniref:Diguanylate cyclase/phosphodiesterase with PAS/PAC sensor(S) n=1 Tax=Sulfurimonas autotrophica (strain ATCC BAA-671 / DSM 16294 / JCM 11897 / OK10) TaxID=563040 RepID=E0US35_SULAO|nr:GGDEF and EAL domain-containing protein [Sulfurimonas autotrophica]ADN09058.1 diguanylate cyclase/phosphodiesterase with PAS/PAC sensor(s) [Sulfurimonas autotrophica DSM 16294]